ncbi:MAG TPA: fumarylacetoacetate hydrolase family protein [Pyrinomonadaceae bacterium]|nr:fumarylacetoacetate hydrolase family protein [Pyrinomonadaceae bacterium]
MKLVTCKNSTAADRYDVGILRDDDTVVVMADDLRAVDVNAFLDLDSGLLQRADNSLRHGTSKIIDRNKLRLAAPVPRPGKVICIGLNYRNHAIESGMDIPKSPIIFSKFSSCVVAPDDPVRIPTASTQTDYEAELAFVIGRRASNVKAADAMNYVLGYTNFNDVSARDFQFADGQWQRGKSCDTFAPMGPFIATADEIADPHDLRIRFRLNGETFQDSTTSELIFRIPELVEFLSSSITLEPGDVVATGTPPGVGFARKPPVYLKSGDVCEVEIEGLSVLSNPVA